VSSGLPGRSLHLREYKYWTNVEPGTNPRPLIVDSVQPVATARLVDLVAVDHQVTPEIRLEPSHGHTPGHVSIRIDSQGKTLSSSAM
jgi:glyoxylase-like metal-dependent hydrolase (beta-lactamase superfamily II)